MSTPAAELDFQATIGCRATLHVNNLIRHHSEGLFDWSVTVEWASNDTAIVRIGHVEFGPTEGPIKVGNRIRFVWPTK